MLKKSQPLNFVPVNKHNLNLKVLAYDWLITTYQSLLVLRKELVLFTIQDFLTMPANETTC